MEFFREGTNTDAEERSMLRLNKITLSQPLVFRLRALGGSTIFLCPTSTPKMKKKSLVEVAIMGSSLPMERKRGLKSSKIYRQSEKGPWRSLREKVRGGPGKNGVLEARNLGES